MAKIKMTPEELIQERYGYIKQTLMSRDAIISYYEVVRRTGINFGIGNPSN